jgi:hypothetical protein
MKHLKSFKDYPILKPKQRVKCVNKLISNREGGLNFYPNFTYNLFETEFSNGTDYEVCYEDGRGYTFSEDMFNSNFVKIDQ